MHLDWVQMNPYAPPDDVYTGRIYLFPCTLPFLTLQILQSSTNNKIMHNTFRISVIIMLQDVGTLPPKKEINLKMI